MKQIWVVLVVVVVAGCGKNRPALKWPAEIAKLDGFPEQTQTALRKTIGDLNTRVGKTIVVIGNGESTGALSIVQVKELQPIAGSKDVHLCSDTLILNTADAGVTSRIAGRATLSEGSCKIEIASFVNSEDGGELLESVLWHELGHCAGLMHEGQSGEIMYRTTTSFRKYQQAALQRFVATFLSAVGEI